MLPLLYFKCSHLDMSSYMLNDIVYNSILSITTISMKNNLYWNNRKASNVTGYFWQIVFPADGGCT